MQKVSEFVSAKIGDAISNIQNWADLFYNVQNYGIYPDGSDVTIKLQSLVDAAVLAGRTSIVFPSGNYVVTAITNDEGLSYFGDGVTFTGGYSKTVYSMGSIISQFEETMRFVSIAKYGASPGEDISAAMYQALQENDFVYVPPGTYYIDPAYTKRTFIRSGVPTTFGAGIDIYRMNNKHIFFSGTIQSITSNIDWIQIINVQESTNVHLYFPKVIGDKDTHVNGEWAHGIGIYSSDEVYVYGPNVSKTFGDGIYTGVFYHDTSGIQQGHVEIIDPIIDNCSRNGISLTSGKNTVIKNPIITNITRVDPKSGIDVEPEGIGTALPILENVLIDNVRVEGCDGPGVIMSLVNLFNRSLSVNITLRDYYSNGNRFGFDILGGVGSLFGNITLRGLNIVNSKYFGFRTQHWHDGMPHLDIQDMKQINNNALTSTDEGGSGVLLYNNIATDLSNIFICNPDIRDNRTPKKVTYPIWIRSEGAGITGLSIQNPIHMDGLYNMNQFAGNSNYGIKMIDGYVVDKSNSDIAAVTVTSNVTTSFYDVVAKRIGKVVYVSMLFTLSANVSVGASLITFPNLPIFLTRIPYQVDGTNEGRADLGLDGVLRTQTAQVSGKTLTANFSYITG